MNNTNISEYTINFEKFKEFMSTKLNNPCILCGERNWNVSDKYYELREFTGGNMIIGGNTGIIPLIPLTCSKCGNTILINAVVSGFLK